MLNIYTLKDMKTENFIKLINAITGKDFILDVGHDEIELNFKYYIYRKLPISKRRIGFYFTTPKNEENLVKSFINNYTKKYLEPDPENYNYKYGDKDYKWDDKTEEQKEFAYYNHRSYMYSPQSLTEQIKANLNKEGIDNILSRYGFYTTNYGIGIFVIFSTKYEISAIDKLKEYLSNKNIPYKNEFSNAKWVYRFVLSISKEMHNEILKDFNNINNINNEN